MLNNITYLPGDSILISDIGTQPPDERSNPGSTLVCVTTNINTACCRGGDNNEVTNGTAGAVGEWYYPNETLVLRGNVTTDFRRVGYKHQVRLARVLATSIPPLGEYICKVPDPSTGVLCNASITIQTGK